MLTGGSRRMVVHRTRAAAVCKNWKAICADPRMWEAVNLHDALSPASGSWDFIGRKNSLHAMLECVVGVMLWLEEHAAGLTQLQYCEEMQVSPLPAGMYVHTQAQQICLEASAHDRIALMPSQLQLHRTAVLLCGSTDLLHDTADPALQVLRLCMLIQIDV